MTGVIWQNPAVLLDAEFRNRQTACRRASGATAPGAVSFNTGLQWKKPSLSLGTSPLKLDTFGRQASRGPSHARKSPAPSTSTMFSHSGSAPQCYPVPVRPVEALYENGTLKPAKPLNLRQGERVAAIVVRQPDASLWHLARLAAQPSEDEDLASQGITDWTSALDHEGG